MHRDVREDIRLIEIASSFDDLCKSAGSAQALSWLIDRMLSDEELRRMEYLMQVNQIGVDPYNLNIFY